MRKRDITKPTFYLDACVLIDLIELPPSDPRSRAVATVLAKADDGHCNVVTSVLTIAEVLYAKHEIDRKALDPRVETKIAQLWHPDASPIELVEVHELIVRDAAALLREHLAKEGWSKTKGVDAVHLVTARREFVNEFFTTEGAMSKWGRKLGFKVCAPHPATPASLFTMPPAPTPVTLPQDGDDYWVWRLSKNRQLADRSPSQYGAQRSLRKE